MKEVLVVASLLVADYEGCGTYTIRYEITRDCHAVVLEVTGDPGLSTKQLIERYDIRLEEQRAPRTTVVDLPHSTSSVPYLFCERTHTGSIAAAYTKEYRLNDPKYQHTLTPPTSFLKVENGLLPRKETYEDTRKTCLFH
jgi:hypothetical protein